MTTFMESCLRGGGCADGIDEAVERWHEINESDPNTVVTLREHLGMTYAEYMAWVENPAILHDLIDQRGVSPAFGVAAVQAG